LWCDNDMSSAYAMLMLQIAKLCSSAWKPVTKN